MIHPKPMHCHTLTNALSHPHQCTVTPSLMHYHTLQCTITPSPMHYHTLTNALSHPHQCTITLHLHTLTSFAHCKVMATISGLLPLYAPQTSFSWGSTLTHTGIPSVFPVCTVCPLPSHQFTRLPLSETPQGTLHQ